MQPLGARWLVEYDDGTVLRQEDRTSPHFRPAANHPDGGEVPYKAIAWPRARAVEFRATEGGADGGAWTRFACAPAPAGLAASLHSRHFTGGVAELEGTFTPVAGVQAFLVALTPEGQVPGRDTTVNVFYWLADGAMHECAHYDCPLVARYADAFCHGRDAFLPLLHEDALASEESV